MLHCRELLVDQSGRVGSLSRWRCLGQALCAWLGGLGGPGINFGGQFPASQFRNRSSSKRGVSKQEGGEVADASVALSNTD